MENHRRILHAARQHFGEEGIDASLHALARRAGVGVGTLYRHFPTHDDLIRALYDLLVAELARVEEDVRASATGWDGVIAYVDGMVEVYATDRAAPAILQRMSQIDPAYRPAERYRESMEWFVRRAKEEGALRADITAADFAFIPFSIAAALRFPEPQRTVVLARQRALLLDGLRPAAASRPLPGSDPTVDDAHAASHGQEPPP